MDNVLPTSPVPRITKPGSSIPVGAAASSSVLQTPVLSLPTPDSTLDLSQDVLMDDTNEAIEDDETGQVQAMAIDEISTEEMEADEQPDEDLPDDEVQSGDRYSRSGEGFPAQLARMMALALNNVDSSSDSGESMQDEPRLTHKPCAESDDYSDKLSSSSSSSSRKSENVSGKVSSPILSAVEDEEDEIEDESISGNLELSSIEEDDDSPMDSPHEDEDAPKSPTENKKGIQTRKNSENGQRFASGSGKKKRGKKPILKPKTHRVPAPKDGNGLNKSVPKPKTGKARVPGEVLGGDSPTDAIDVDALFEDIGRNIFVNTHSSSCRPDANYFQTPELEPNLILEGKPAVSYCVTSLMPKTVTLNNLIYAEA